MADFAASTATGFRAWGSSAAKLALLFSGLFLGIIGSWFYPIGTKYLDDPSQGLQLGTPVAFVVRLILSAIIGGVIFAAVYSKIKDAGNDVGFFIAFQNGFFWNALLAGVFGTAT